MSTNDSNAGGGRCGSDLCFILRSQFVFQGGEQSRQDDPQVARQSVSSHGRQEGQHARVDRRSSQLQRSKKDVTHQGEILVDSNYSPAPEEVGYVILRVLCFLSSVIPLSTMR